MQLVLVSQFCIDSYVWWNIQRCSYLFWNKSSQIVGRVKQIFLPSPLAIHSYFMLNERIKNRNMLINIVQYCIFLH